jgi:hypothetical protein
MLTTILIHPNLALLPMHSCVVDELQTVGGHGGLVVVKRKLMHGEGTVWRGGRSPVRAETAT